MSPIHDHRELRRPNIKALFSLVPLNLKAKVVVEDHNNNRLVSKSWESNVASFDIGFHLDSQFSANTLATLGRDNCDIHLRSTTIARTHCSFEIDDLNTGIVMFYDRSHKHNTRVSSTTDSYAQPFEKGRSPRKVLLYPGVNDKISMGGTKGEMIEFEIEWILDEDQIKKVAREHRDAEKNTITNPRKARTRDPTETVLNSAKMTPEEAFLTPSQSRLRYFKRELLGLGSFGKVWRTIDVDSGRVMAMKQIDRVPGSQEQDYVRKVRREVELMRRAKHVRLRLPKARVNDADPDVAKYCKLDHIAGLGGGLFLHQDIHVSRRGKPRWFKY